MKKLKDKLLENGAAVALVILIIVAVYAVSWLITCVIVRLIAGCFGMECSWLVATGIWLVICLLKACFSGSNK